MAYYMRYIVTDDAEITLSTLERVLKEIDPAYAITESGELKHGSGLYGVIEINRPGDGLFDEEIVELKEFVKESRGKKRAAVLRVLDDARAIIAVQVLFQDRDTEETLDKINPLWEWLFSHHKGLLQADGEGYYDHAKLILEVE